MLSLKNARMCAEIARYFPLEKPVEEAICAINREEFVSPKHLAYSLNALPLDGEQFISSPLTVAKMTQYLQLRGVDSVLEIGCGSGYQAMVLSKLVRRVFSIERIEKLLVQAKERFRHLGVTNIHTKLADGQEGWREFAPFERILFSACATHIPQALVEQLSEGGILLAPMLEGNTQIITRFTKQNGRLLAERLEKCQFVPVLDGIERGV
ncbi:protein-L-isoaspartate(D-aspartate) O-methyltransferase [Helicobacter sp. NHP22-001]|uniref:protein-L-isoaspartate(D-aspartate) O-methyltransferase n=1 Tax=Helicobacter sp. NHP22-001 TaxID=3040202 RepID=UPI00244D85E9|nr:protein-L-isoaspartate(D-aspartate) O-methyltransferase [Helicobacter sp. NHP22-001]GMB96001.1 Protein-L-isoaspartate O-methyltransferase Pcm [Helicobacter sp. NHP22-001]